MQTQEKRGFQPSLICVMFYCSGHFRRHCSLLKQKGVKQPRLSRGRESTWVASLTSVEVHGGDACGRVGKDSEAVSTPDRKSSAGPDEQFRPRG